MDKEMKREEAIKKIEEQLIEFNCEYNSCVENSEREDTLYHHASGLYDALQKPAMTESKVKKIIAKTFDKEKLYNSTQDYLSKVLAHAIVSKSALPQEEKK